MNILDDRAVSGAADVFLHAVSNRFFKALGVCVFLALGACSTTPPGTMSYYLPQATTDLKVSQTLVCNATGDTLVQVASVTPTTTYSSDPNAVAVFRLSSVDGPLANAEVGIEYTKDGRLAGVNTATVGQAGEVIKGVIAVAKLATFIPAKAAAEKYTPQKACQVIARYSAKAATDEKKEEKKEDKKVAAPAAAKTGGDTQADVKAQEPKSLAGTVTLTYYLTVKYERNTDANLKQKVVFGKQDDGKVPGATIDFHPDANSAVVYSALSEVIPGLVFQLTLEGTTDMAVPTWSTPITQAGSSTDDSTDSRLWLNGLTGAKLKITGLGKDPKDATVRSVFWTGTVPVPLTGKDDRFAIPLPKAAFFGSRKFSLSLTDYGTISKISYNSTNAVSEGASAATAIASVIAAGAADKTDAQLAAAFKDSSDKIYQETRNAHCIAEPTDCAK